MAGKKSRDALSQPDTVSLDEMLERGPAAAHNTTSDPAMRDGNASHGTPYETAVDEITTDNDVGDTIDTGEPLAGPGGGAINGARVRGGRVGRGISHDTGRDSTIGRDPAR